MTQELKRALETTIAAGLNGGEYQVTVNPVKRTNSRERMAVTISKPGNAVGAVIYIDDQTENTVAEIACAVIERYNCSYDPGISSSVAEINRDYILSNVIYRPASVEGNRKPDEEVLYRNVLDVIMLYSVPLKLAGTDLYGHFNVTSKILENYGIDYAQLDAAAQRNTLNNGFAVKSMEDILSEVMGFHTGEVEGAPPMYVITNTRKMFGASVLLYQEYFEALALKLGNLFILPSSVHEVIVIPADGDLATLKDMVGSVNATEVSEEDFLSNNVYIYDKEKQKLEIA